MTNENPLTVPSFLLERTIEVLETRGWCQEARVLLVSGNEKWCCLTAAMVIALGYPLAPDMKVGVRIRDRKGWIGLETIHRPNRSDGITTDQAFAQMGRHVKLSFLTACRYLREATGAEDLEAWNDLPTTTYADVLDALSLAGAKAIADGN